MSYLWIFQTNALCTVPSNIIEDFAHICVFVGHAYLAARNCYVLLCSTLCLQFVAFQLFSPSCISV